MKSPEGVPVNEPDRMVAYAEELRTLGYRGARIGGTGVDLILAAARTVNDMKALAECSFRLSNPYVCLAAGDEVEVDSVGMPALLMAAYVDDEVTPVAVVRWLASGEESRVPWMSLRGVSSSGGKG